MNDDYDQSQTIIPDYRAQRGLRQQLDWLDHVPVSRAGWVLFGGVGALGCVLLGAFFGSRDPCREGLPNVQGLCHPRAEVSWDPEARTVVCKCREGK